MSKNLKKQYLYLVKSVSKILLKYDVLGVGHAPENEYDHEAQKLVANFSEFTTKRDVEKFLTSIFELESSEVNPELAKEILKIKSEAKIL